MRVLRRYNTALYQSAVESNLLEEIQSDISQILRLINSLPDFRLFLESPVINISRKKEVLKSLFEGRINHLTLKFLILLCDKNRINNLKDICTDFLDYADRKKGILRAEIQTAVELSETEKNAIVERLSKFTKSYVSAEYKINPEIIGGFIARIDDRIIDASIKRQLELLKDKFSQVNFN
jgi:F-type H+-transporting ATPase subunit delta